MSPAVTLMSFAPVMYTNGGAYPLRYFRSMPIGWLSERGATLNPVTFWKSCRKLMSARETSSIPSSHPGPLYSRRMNRTRALSMPSGQPPPLPPPAPSLPPVPAPAPSASTRLGSAR